MWLEVGFGWWLGGQFQGPSGRAKLGVPPTITKDEAKALLEWIAAGVEKKPRRSRGVIRSGLTGGWKDLPGLVGWNFRHYYSETPDIELHWLASKAFVAFLMDPNNRIPGSGKLTRDGLLTYMRQAYRSAKGNSSSLLDQCLGCKVEKLEAPFYDWIAARMN